MLALSDAGATVIVSLVAAFSGLFTVVYQRRARSENSTDHGKNAEMLRDVLAGIKSLNERMGGVENRMASHLEWHVTDRSRTDEFRSSSSRS